MDAGLDNTCAQLIACLLVVGAVAVAVARDLNHRRWRLRLLWSRASRSTWRCGRVARRRWSASAVHATRVSHERAARHVLRFARLAMESKPVFRFLAAVFALAVRWMLLSRLLVASCVVAAPAVAAAVKRAVSTRLATGTGAAAAAASLTAMVMLVVLIRRFDLHQRWYHLVSNFDTKFLVPST